MLIMRSHSLLRSSLLFHLDIPVILRIKIISKNIVNCIIQRIRLFYLYTKKRLRVLLTQALLRKSLYQLTCLMQHLKPATLPDGGALRA